MDHREHLPNGAELAGNYRIDGVLGQGGFGVTYAATDLALNKTVAIKEYFPTDFASRDSSLSIRQKSERHGNMFEWGRERFLDEARTLAQFRHPAIVRVQHFFEALNTGYLVLEFEEGKTLRNWCSALGRPASQDEIDRIVSPLVDALAKIHEADFIHRDIAPDNIIIRRDGSPVLLDFGAARHALAAETRSLTGIIKSGFSPPEQYLTDASAQGPWSDVYALGATLYQVVTGEAPPEAPARQMQDTYVPAASASQGDYRAAFLSALDWSLKLNIEDRPPSISAFKAALSDAQEPSVPVPASEPIIGTQRIPDAVSAPLAASTPKRAGAGGLRLGAAVAAGLVLLGAGGYVVDQRLDAERQRLEAIEKARAERATRLAKEAARAAEAERQRKAAERKRVQAEKRRQAEALRRADEDAWKQATTEPITIAKLEAYLEKFPSGLHGEAARARISAINSEEKRKTQVDIAICQHEQNVDLRVGGCTRLLEQGKLSETNRASVYNNRGIAYFKKAKYDRALADFESSIKLKPQQAKVYFNRGMVHAKKGSLTLAIAEFDKAIELGPRLAVAYLERGRAYFNKRRYSRAIADFTEVIKIQPRDATAYNNRGATYARMGMRAKAIADYRKALKIEPSYRLARRNLRVLRAKQ